VEVVPARRVFRYIGEVIVIGREDCASSPTSLNRSISKLKNRAVILYPCRGNFILRNLYFAPPCLFGLLRLWRRTFTLSTAFSLARGGFFFRSTLRSRVLNILIVYYFCLPYYR
jgi:hypothetical protein